MPLLETPRSRIFAILAILSAAAALGFLLAYHLTQVHAARRAVLAEDPRVYAELAIPAASHPGSNPVLVELFTSEGCSSCPPADALLARLQHDQPVPSAGIIVLEEHVDYWDYEGWHDRFSSPYFTQRQKDYQAFFKLDDIYTPQMVVDGAEQFTGNDTAHALRAITQAARAPKLNLLVPRHPDLGGDGLNLAVSSSASSSLPKADVYAALVQTTASTQVALGENKGRTLNHVSVVRELRKVGTFGQLATPLSFSFKIPKDTTPSDLRIVVFVQAPGQGKIIAAASTTEPAAVE